jgi:YesN/AraC family two-component response regulator
MVLIVEDNDDLRLYLEILLSKHYSTIKAKNGVEAFEMALSFSPDLILSDVMMPEMDGIDLCIKLKDSLETSHIPVVLLTARTIEDAQREGLKAGADDYITKPFVDEVLLLKIHNILTTREQLRSRFSTENKDITEIANTSADAQFMSKFMSMVEKDFSDCNLSVEKIGETIGLSRSQLYKKCLVLTGKSPVDIVQEIRMQNALNLLKNTSLSVSDIAYSVGYSDPRYFSNRFKKMIGTTPSEIRENKAN